MRRTGKKTEETEDKKIFVKGEMKIDCESRRVVIGEKEINLTERNLIFWNFWQQIREKCTAEESLLNIVWGYEYPGDVRTVDVPYPASQGEDRAPSSDPKYVYTKWGVWLLFQGLGCI